MNARDFNAIVQADISALVRAGEQSQTCDHCRGTGTVATYNPNGTKPCWACDGTGGPRRYKLAYNRHQG